MPSPIGDSIIILFASAIAGAAITAAIVYPLAMIAALIEMIFGD